MHIQSTISTMPFLSPKQLVCFVAVLLLAALPHVLHAEEDDQTPPVKNVLLIVSDDLKASVLGCYGDPHCETPNIDALARQSVVFDRAYCQGTWCAPSRQSFMYSRYRGEGKVTLGEHFIRQGWYSARVGKIFHMRVPGDIIAGTDGQDVAACWTERFNSPGLEAHTPGDYACLNLDIFTTELEGRQSTRMPHRAFVTVKYEGDGSDQPDHKSATKAIELLRERQKESFFLAVGFVRPHYPMVAPRQYFDPYPHQQIELPEVPEGDLEDIPPLGISGSRSAKNGLDKYPDNQRRMWSAYYATVTFMDEQVGRILDELDRLGLRETTVIAFTSDHGYHLGEHTFWQKHNLHEEVVRVPLMISAPSYQPGRTDSIVELVDIYPTLVDLAGSEPDRSVQGKSLVPILEDHEASVRDGALSFTRGAGLRTDRWAFMRYNDGKTELYDMQTDPQQFNNLSGDPQHAEQVAKLEERLQQRLEAADRDSR